MTAFLASFFGAIVGQALCLVLGWRYYLAPKLASIRVRQVSPHRTVPAARSQTATTRGFVDHEQPVTIQRADWGRMKRTRL